MFTFTPTAATNNQKSEKEKLEAEVAELQSLNKKLQEVVHVQSMTIQTIQNEKAKLEAEIMQLKKIPQTAASNMFQPASQTTAGSIFGPTNQSNSERLFQPPSLFQPTTQPHACFQPSTQSTASSIFKPEGSIFGPTNQSNTGSLFQPPSQPTAPLQPTTKPNYSDIFGPASQPKSNIFPIIPGQDSTTSKVTPKTYSFTEVEQGALALSGDSRTQLTGDKLRTAIAIITEAIKYNTTFNERKWVEMCIKIKDEFQQAFGGIWHCIASDKEFFSRVESINDDYIQVKLDDMLIEMFRSH